MPLTRGNREVPTNQTPASTSDARKRINEAMDALRDGLIEAVENMDTSKVEAFLAAGYEAFHQSPPVPDEPWSVISTDREKPTLAKVTWRGNGGVTGTFSAEVYLHENRDGEDCLEFANGHVGTFAVSRDFVTSVELLHTHNPETHVPVERALIDEAAEYPDIELVGLTRCGYPEAARIIRALAALADDLLDGEVSA